MEMGLIQVYTGDGKGKTTAALGLALRAAGHGFKTCVVQFMKGKTDYGELFVTKRIPEITIEQFGRPDFVEKGNPEPEDVQGAKDALEYASQAMLSGVYDIVVLDEVNVAVDFGLVSETDVLLVLEEKPRTVELVLTGRYAPQSFLDKADLVSEVREIKHPFDEGVMARKGIEN